MIPFATLSDIVTRYPSEIGLLAANEDTGLRDDARVEAAIVSASAEMRGILKGRYSARELDRLDDDSLEMLRVLAIDIALYRVALSFSRSTDRLEKGYDTAIKRLEKIASGAAGLSFDGGDDGGGDDPSSPGSAASPNEVLIDAPEDRFFSIRRMGRL